MGDRGKTVPLISVAQAAALLGVHPNTIRTWTDAGRLAAYRINARGDRRYRRSDVEHLLAEGAGRGESPPLIDELHHDVDEHGTAELSVLARLATGAAAGASAAAFGRTVVDNVRLRLGVARVALYLAHEGWAGRLELQAHGGYDEPPPALLSTDEVGLSTEARSTGSVTRQLHWLRAGGEVLGALVIEDEPGGPLAGTRPSFLRMVAAATAAGIYAARSLARARREADRGRALRHVTQELTGQLDLGTVLNDIVDRTHTLFAADKVGLWLAGEGEHPFEVAASRSISDAFLEKIRTLTWESPAVGVQAMRERRTLVAREAGSRPGIGSMQVVYQNEGIETACLVPLVSQGRALGVIGLYHTRDHDWPEDELALAQSFADQAAVAISNARLYHSLGDQAARLRSIQDLSSRLNRLTDVQAIADAIVAEASTLAAYHDIRVYTVNWEERVCEPIAYTDRLLGDGDFRERLRVDVGEGSFTGWVAEHGEPLLSNDALNDPRGHTIEGTDDVEESMLVVPMVFEGRSVGVIALSKLGRNQFTTDDQQTMTIFAGYAAQAMANATAYERLAQQSTELTRQLISQRRLLEINERLLSTLDSEDVLETIADGLLSVVHYDNLSIYRADHVNRQLVPVLARERHAEQVRNFVIPFGRGLMGWAVDHGEPVLANDALNDPRAVQIPGTPPDPEALCVVPLLSEGEVIGCMNISRVGGREIYFSDNDFELTKLFAGQASIAMRNAEAHTEVSHRADTDALTGLGNHGAFQRTLADELEAPAGRRKPVSLLMMDLDRFKGYNDRLGHPAGDALLHAVGTAIYGAARSEDRVFRYGGDEFALVLPGVDAVGARAIGDRIRGAVARLTANEPMPVTIAIGSATFPGDASDKNDLIAAADTALYYGKQAGGDRLIACADVPQEMRDLRSTLDQLARAALQRPDEAAVGTLAEHAARLGTAKSNGSDATLPDAILALARAYDERPAAGRGRAARVARLAGRLCEQLGCPPEEVRSVELAARLHAIKGFAPSQLASIAPLRHVGEIVEAHAAGGEPTRVPLGSQVIAVASAYDNLLTGSEAPRLGRAAALERLRAGIGPRFRRDVVEALAGVVAARPHRGEHRRREDTSQRERGAA